MHLEEINELSIAIIKAIKPLVSEVTALKEEITALKEVAEEQAAKQKEQEDAEVYKDMV